MHELITYYYHYNSWATDRVIESCKALSDEEYRTTAASGNGSIGETLSHLILVQQGWLAWFAGNMEMREAFAIMTQGTLTTLEDAKERWAVVNDETAEYIAALTDAALKAERSFTRRDGKSFSFPLWKLLMHTANHGTHTRAQITAAIRHAGHDPQNIDLMNFVMNG